MSRGVEPSVEESVEKNNVDRCSCRGGVPNEAKTQKRRLIDPPAIEGLGTFSIDPPSCQGSVEIAIRTKFKILRNSQVSRMYQGGVEIA